MTEESKKNFARPENDIRFWTHRNIVFNALKNETGLTFREVANKVRLRPDCCWKRLSELHRAGKIKIIGDKKENGFFNSVYAINNDPGEVKPVPTLREWMKVEHPDILHKWQVLKKHAI